MEDDRVKFVVKAAGYKNNMEQFITSNPGLKSRFTHFIHLDDYVPDELFGIFELITRKRGYTLTQDGEEHAKQAIEDMYNNRGADFANGRSVRNLFDTIVRRQSARLAELSREERTDEVLAAITAADIPVFIKE